MGSRRYLTVLEKDFLATYSLLDVKPLPSGSLKGKAYSIPHLELAQHIFPILAMAGGENHLIFTNWGGNGIGVDR